MVKQMNNEILAKIDEIVDYIKETDDYKDYFFLKEKLENNDKAKLLIQEIKNLQQDLVKKQAMNLEIAELDKEIKEKVVELEKIPLYQEFIEKQDNLNNMYQVIKNRLDDYFIDKLN